MELLYTSAELTQAYRLADALDEAGVEAHVAGEHAAQVPGLPRHPSAVAVWVATADAVRAREVMRRAGFLPVASSRPALVARHSVGWVVFGACALVVALTLVLAGGR
jgi:hypothetical protein